MFKQAHYSNSDVKKRAACSVEHNSVPDEGRIRVISEGRSGCYTSVDRLHHALE